MDILPMRKIDRIEQRKKEIGSRHGRVLKTFSYKFNTIFNFFISSYRADILTFGGSDVAISFDINGPCAKEFYRLYENGIFSSGKPMTSRHPLIAKASVIAKKSWGLHVDAWSDGIAEWSFNENELLTQFKDHNIIIPESLLVNFYDTVDKKKIERNKNYLKLISNV
jgi:hypothetical protein